MNSAIDTYTLNNGVKIPCIGFGTWQAPDGEATVNVIKTALTAGYRHIDTAANYGNEASVGTAIKESGIPRKDIFVTTKLNNKERGYEMTITAMENSMKVLQLDYIDLYLIHWPNPVTFRHDWEKFYTETWKAIEEFYNAGRIRAIGLSNAYTHHLDAILKIAKVKPAVNQIRLCPGNTKKEVVKASLERGMLLEAYSPMGGTPGTKFGANILKSPLLLDLERKYNKSAAQICVRWCLQQDYLPLPKSSSAEHMAANINVFDFELSDDDVKILNNLEGYPDPFPHPDETSW